MAKVGHSYWDYVSWPSSLAVTNDREKREWLSEPVWRIPASRGDTVAIRGFMKASGIPAGQISSVTGIWEKDGERVGETVILLRGDSEWVELSSEDEINVDVDNLEVRLTVAGGGATTMFDDLKVLRNGEIMIEDGFSNYTPYGIGVGVAVAGIVGTKWLGWW